MGYSVGYRSLQSDQLLSILAEDLSKQSSFESFFADPYRQEADHTNHLDPQIVEWAQSELLILARQPTRLAQLIGKHLSLSKTDLFHDHVSFDIQLLTNDTSIKIDNVFSANWHQSEDAIHLNIEGESSIFEKKYLPMVKKLASYQQVPIKLFNFSAEAFDFPEVLTNLINRGYIKHIK